MALGSLLSVESVMEERARCMHTAGQPVQIEHMQLHKPLVQEEMAKASADMKRHRTRLAKMRLRRRLRARLHRAQFKPPRAKIGAAYLVRMHTEMWQSSASSVDGAAPWEEQTIDWDSSVQCPGCMEIVAFVSVECLSEPVCPLCGSSLGDEESGNEDIE